MFWGCAFSGPSCQKKQFLDTPPKKKKILTDNWKALFWVFCVFKLFLFLFFVFSWFFFWGFKGQVRWPEGPRGFKGQVRWPKGPPQLALNPPYLFIFVFVFVFVFLSFLCFESKNLFSPWKEHFLFIFCVSLSFFLNLFWPPPFSVSLSLSLSLLLLSFFLPSCLSFLLSFCFVFLSIFHFSFFFAFVFWKEQHENFKLHYCLVFPFKSLFLIFVCFLILSYVVCSTWMFLVSKQTTFKKTHFWGEKGGCNNFFFVWTCVLQNVKSHRSFSPPFLPYFGGCSKNNIKIGISAHI